MRQLLIGRFWAPRLLRLQSPLERTLSLVGPPLLWGALCGLLSGVDRAAYLAGLVLSLGGAFGAGRQHLSAGPAALRGLIAGTIFGSSVLAGRALAGGGSALLHPESLQVVFTAAVAAAFAAFGGLTRLREQGRAGVGVSSPGVAGVIGSED